MWNNIEESHAEDETISNAFSSRGIYRISTNGEVHQMPQVHAGVNNSQMFINVDNTLLLLEDEPLGKCSIITFEVNVDCLVALFDGTLLLCGLNNGEIHGISIRGKLIFRCSINEEDVNMTGRRTFVTIQQFNNCIFFICSNGSTYKLYDVDEAMLQAVTSQDDMSAECDISVTEINVKRIFVIKASQEILAALLMPNDCEEEPNVIVGTHSYLYQRKHENQNVRLDIPSIYNGIKQIYYIENEILLLTYSGHLLKYCSTVNILLLSIKRPKEFPEIEDLLITDCNSERIEFLVLAKQGLNAEITTEREKGDGDNKVLSSSYSLNIMEYPAFKTINDLELTDKTVWLVKQPKSSVNLYFITGKELNSQGLPNVLELMIISETDPSDRFNKLIIRGRLDEAEDYGRQFCLCLQPIYEARAKHLLIEMSSLNSFAENYAIIIEERFNLLKDLFKKIENKDFFKVRRSFNLPSRQILQNYLQEVVKYLDPKLDVDVILEIREELDRLETLKIVDPYEVDSEWLKFVHHKNLIKYLMQLLKTDIPMACLIWSRHSSCMLKHLSDMDVRLLLTVIPDDMTHLHLLQWLRQFIPIISNTHPTVMSYVMEWSKQKTYLLQHSQLWPEIGLEFCTDLMDIFDNINFLYTDVRRGWDRNICELRDLLNALQDLCVLKHSYNLIFTLNNYLQESIDEIAICMLLRVHVDNIKSLVNDFLYPIYQEKGESPIPAIKRYIKLLVASRKTFTSWLERSVHCIELLYNEDDRLELALLVLQNAPVPWPEVAEPLVKLRYCTHSLGEKIKNEYEKQVIKILKVKYNWPIDVTSSSYSIVDSDIQLLMMRIVKVSLPEMFDDIYTLIKAIPEIANAANFNVCYQLLQRGAICRAFEFFQKLQQEKNGQYAKHVIDMFASLLENSSMTLDGQIVNEQVHQQIEFYRLLTTTAVGRSDKLHKKRLNMIENYFTLTHHYKIPIKHVDELYVKSNCDKFLKLGVIRILKCVPRNHNGTYIIKYIMKELRMLSNALNLNHIFALKCLCVQANCLPLSCVLTYRILDAFSCNKDIYTYYIDLALVLIIQQMRLIKALVNNSDSSTQMNIHNRVDDINNYWAFPLAYELLAQTVLCVNHDMPDTIELMNFIRLVQNSVPYQNYQQYELYMDECEKHLLQYMEYLIKQYNINDHNNGKMNDNGDATEFLNSSKCIEPRKHERVSISIFDQIDVTTVETETNASSAVAALTTTAANNMNCTDYIRNVRFVANSILLLITIIPEHETKSTFLGKLRNMFTEHDSPIKLDFTQIYDNFLTSLKQLIRSKKHNLWYIIMQYFIDYQQRYKYSNSLIDATQFVKTHITKILRHALSNKDVNFLDLFNMLIANGNAESDLEKLSQELKTNLQKMHFLTLEEMCNKNDEQIATVEAIRLKRLKYFYYGKFGKIDANVLDKFNPEIDPIEVLIKYSESKLLDIKLLERMSRDFTLNYQNLLVSQVISILQSQEMKFEVICSSSDDEELNMMTTVDSIREQCQSYLMEIKNIDLLTTTLKRFIEQIHIYFYEMYLCVIEILEYFEAVPKEMQLWKSILHFLKYKMICRRHNRAEQWETDMWLESQNEIGVLPKIARYRLPFKPFVELPLKDVLNSELNVANCESWFPLIQMHTLLKGSQDLAHNCDYFCMVAVKNCITEYKSQSDPDVWHKQPTNNAFLQSVLRLVKHIENKTKAFLTLYFVSNYAPEGADQVEASYECYKYLMENEKVIMADIKCVEKADKIKRKYPNLKTQHLLRIYGLNDEKLFGFIEQPKELICQLYHHDIILNNGKLSLSAEAMNDKNGVSYTHVNINVLAKEIANLHNIKLELLQLALLQQWLSFTISESPLENVEDSILEQSAINTTITKDNQGFYHFNNKKDSTFENVMRANYIMNTWPMETAVHFLIAQIFPSNCSENTAQQLQMFECYFKLYDGRGNLDNTLLNQQQYINIKCVHDLKQLGYNINLQKFKISNKIDILKDIWQQRLNSNTNPLMMKTLANICLGFHIHIDKIWNGILKLMVKYQMNEDLNALVDVLSCKAQLKHIDGLVLAWEYVLLQPFELVFQQQQQQHQDTHSNFNADNLLNRTLVRIQCCPVIHSLNLIKFVERCLTLNRCNMAAIFLSFCKTSEQRQKIKELINPLKMENMRKQILQLEDIGISPLILNFALNELSL